jgi:hypothetical protein
MQRTDFPASSVHGSTGSPRTEELISFLKFKCHSVLMPSVIPARVRHSPMEHLVLPSSRPEAVVSHQQAGGAMRVSLFISA